MPQQHSLADSTALVYSAALKDEEEDEAPNNTFINYTNPSLLLPQPRVLHLPQHPVPHLQLPVLHPQLLLDVQLYSLLPNPLPYNPVPVRCDQSLLQQPP